MLEHARKNHYHFRREDVSILSNESDWVERGIKEAIYIRALSPTINIDPGCQTLSSHFDGILNQNIKAPTTPAPHNAESKFLINMVPRRQGRPKQPSSNTQLPHQPELQQQQTQGQRRSQRILKRNSQ